jgi:hypothetical protein
MRSLKTGLAVLLLCLAGSVWPGSRALGQDERGETRRAEEAARRAEEAARREAEEARRELRESQNELTDFLRGNYWDSPAGRRRAEQMRQAELRDAMDRFRELGLEPWATRYDENSGRWVLEDREQAQDLEEAVSIVIAFVERVQGLDPMEVEPPPDEELSARLTRVRAMVMDVAPHVPALTSGDLLDVGLFLSVRADLARIRDLSRALQD